MISLLLQGLSNIEVLKACGTEYDFVEREVFNNLSVPMMHPEEYEDMMMYGYD